MLFLPLHQVLIYADDFKSERADRERAQGQIQDLKEQIYQLKQQRHKKVRRRPSKHDNMILHIRCRLVRSFTASVTRLAFSRERAERAEKWWFPCAACTSGTGSPRGDTRTLPTLLCWGPRPSCSNSPPPPPPPPSQRQPRRAPRGASGPASRSSSALDASPHSATRTPQSTWTIGKSVPEYKNGAETRFFLFFSFFFRAGGKDTYHSLTVIEHWTAALHG